MQSLNAYLYDTTLRDGSQQAAISFSVQDKIKIAKRLDSLGIHYVEGGWPGANPKDSQFFKEMTSSPLRFSKLVAFGCTRKPGINAESDAGLAHLLSADTPVVCVVGKTWDFHVHNALKCSLEENLSMIRDTIAFLKSQGKEAVFDAEHFFDGFKANREYALATLRCAAAAGADWLVLCDTNGGTLPDSLETIIKVVQSETDAPLGIHAHNDSGVAVANSLLAAKLGVAMVQGTINGYGERCGNADLCAIIPNLALKIGIRCITEENLSRLSGLSRYVSEIANLTPLDSQPYVGKNAFSHKAGLHVNALMSDPDTYEHIRPDLVGNERHILISELAGKSNIAAFALNKSVNITGADLSDIVERVKSLEYQGYQFEGAEASLELLMRRSEKGYQPPFTMESLRVVMDKAENNGMSVDATVKIKVGQQRVHTAAEGNGPVNALDNALRKALREFYPALEEFRLLDYKVRVLNGTDGTAAIVRVLIETGNAFISWNTVGVSENIIEASWQALVDSMEYGLWVSSRGSTQ